MYLFINRLKFFFLSFFKFYFNIKYKNNLRVLAYHNVIKSSCLESHIKYLLSSGYNFISIYNLNNYLYKNEPLPPKPVLITFDDGDYSVLENGIPILKKFNLPSVVFIITALIDTNKAFWWDQIRINLKKNGADANTIVKAISKAKKSLNHERLSFLSEFKELESKQLSKSDLYFMQENKMSICNHSHTHPMFDKCTEQEIIDELNNSQMEFQNWGLKDFSFFAYPNGNTNESVQNIFSSKGMEIGFLFDHKVNGKKIRPLSISRIRVNSDTDITEFKVRVSGLQSFLMGLKNKA